MFACFPFLKPVLDGLQSGVLASDVLILGTPKHSREASSALRSWSRNMRKATADDIHLGSHQRLTTQESLHQGFTTTSEPAPAHEIESQQHGAFPDMGGIKKTTAIALTFEPAGDR